MVSVTQGNGFLYFLKPMFSFIILYERSMFMKINLIAIFVLELNYPRYNVFNLNYLKQFSMYLIVKVF